MRRRRSIRRWRARFRVSSRRVGRFLRAARSSVRAALVRIIIVGRRAVRSGVVLGVIAAISLSVGAFAASVYGQFGYYPGRNADAWASRPPAFVGAGSCADCHAGQATTWAASAHSVVTCESCHGPLAGHPAASPAVVAEAPTESPGEAGSPVPLIGIDEPSSVGLVEAGAPGVCLTCHQAVVGRPTGFPTVDPTEHYAGAPCNACHDPHAAVAPQPPDVLHPIAGLPECTFCHSATGLRPLPPTHPSWSGDCLTCHRRPEPGSS